MGIQWKIFLFLLGVCGILIVLLWLFQVVFLDDFYRFVKTATLESRAAGVQEILSTQDVSADATQQSLETIAEKDELCISISASDGSTLFEVHRQSNCVIHNFSDSAKQELFEYTAQSGAIYFDQDMSPRSLTQQPMGNGKGYGRQHREGHEGNTTDATRSTSTLVFAADVTDRNGDTILLLLDSQIMPVDATVATLKVQVILITVVMLLCNALLAFFIARYISRPIRSLNDSAKQMKQGDYSVRFSGAGYREIGELAETLNETAIELSKVEHLRQELIANVSHDLRTPLTLIAGYAEAMRDLPGENNAQNAQIIIDETSRLSHLVSDMLDLSRLQQNGEQAVYAPCNLTALLEQSIASTQELVKNDGYAISFESSQTEIVLADCTRLTQAFYNLLTNAILYCGDDRRIVVRQLSEDADVLVEVQDFGEGIDEQELPYIWDRYYRAGHAHKRAIAGTGLGLSIVRSIIAAHGGSCGVHSTAGKGSTFWFRLRRAPS